MEHFPFDNGKIGALTLRSFDRVVDPANPVKISAFFVPLLREGRPQVARLR